MLYTRRQVGKLMLTIPAAGVALRAVDSFAAPPNSKWAGVQVGLNVPFSFKTGYYISNEDIIRRSVQVGVSGLELRAQPVELALGSPQALAAATSESSRRSGEGAARGRQGGGRAAGAPATPEEAAARAAAAEALRKWRLAVSMSKVAAIRKQYNDAGISINVVKWDDIFYVPPEIVDYAFEVTKALGAAAISCEMPSEDRLVADTTRIGRAADKHKIWVAYHNHGTVTQPVFEEAFATAKFNGANLDMGHFFTQSKASPIPFLRQHHDRIVFLHIKDKTLTGPSLPHGTGEVPIKEALQLIRDNRWQIPAVIELDYQIPAGSDEMKEIEKCLDYAKQCLLS